MDKNMPKMYKGKIDKDINNCQVIFSSLNKDDVLEDSSKCYSKVDSFIINKKIYDIFNSRNYIYKADVTIVTRDGDLKRRIIAKSGNNLITIDNEYINIDDIIDIYQ